MIDVPGEVKKALKSGKFKKEYAIKVSHYEPHWERIYVYFDEDTSIFIANSGTYKATSEADFIIAYKEGNNEEILVYPELIDGIYQTPTFDSKAGDLIYIYSQPVDNEINLYRLVSEPLNEVVDFTINNNSLVAESVKFDERMCSSDNLKYGLCEGASIEFQYFGKENITGKMANVSINVQYEDAQGVLKWYAIPIGFFDIDKCSRQASTGIYKATGYNKLMSDYLDSIVNDKINDDVYYERQQLVDENVTTFDMLTYYLLVGFSASSEFRPITSFYNMTISPSSDTRRGFTYQTNQQGNYISVPLCKTTIRLADQNNLPEEGGLFRLYINSDKYCDLLLDLMTYFGVQTALVRDSSYETDYTSLPTHEYSYNPSIPTTLKIWNNYDVLGSNLTGTTIELRWVLEQRNEEYSKPEPKIFTGYEVEINHPLCYIPSNGSISPAEVWSNLSANDKTAILNKWEAFFNDQDCFRIEQTESGRAGSTILTQSQVEELPEYTLRDIQSSILEINCQYGQIDRVTNMFYAKELNGLRLYPANSLYPDNALYPGGSSLSPNASTYSKLWADEGNVHSWKYLIITYKTLNENNEEIDATLQRTINDNGTDNYNMSDNWIFRNLIWTTEEIEAYADAMAQKMQGVTWFPFEMWLPGLPYMETGDEIEISIKDKSYTSYILQRQLDGIQNLQDTYINGSLDIF